MTINHFKLEEAIDQALEDFMKLEIDDRNSLNMSLLARKYAPRTAAHLVDCITDQPALLFAEAKGGHLCADVLTATIGDLIASAMLMRFKEQAEKEQAEQIRRETFRQNLSITKGI
jgi:hypothetical protein